MKEKKDSTVQLDLDKKNSIFQIWKSLKDSIFNVLFVLLDRAGQEGESLLGIAYQSGIDYVQMFAYPFNAAILSAWNGGQTLVNISNFFYLFNLSTYLPNIGYSTFLAEVYSLIFAIILLIVDIIYVSYSFSKKKFRFTWPLVLLGEIVPLFVTILFIPITQILLNVVNCNPSATNPDVQSLQNYPYVICWQGWHLFHAVVTLLFTSLFVFISSIVALAMFQPRMSSNKLTARQNSKAQIAFIVNKISCQFFFNFTPFNGTLVYCLMLFILSAWLYWTYNIEEPYYDRSVSKFFRICSSYYFWTNSMLLVSQLLQNYNFDGGLVAWLGGLPFIGIIIIFEKKSNIDKLFSSDLKFKSGEELESHLRYVLQLIQTQHTDKNSYMLLIGYIEKHKQICSEDDCPLKQPKNKKSKDFGQMEQNCKQLLKQIQRMYINGLRKYPNSTKLTLSYAFFHLQRTKNKAKAYEEFLKAQKTNPNFQQQFIIYRFKKIIKQNLENQEEQENQSDLIQIIRFDNHISLCQQSMLLSARLHKQFWAQLKQEIPDLKKLNQIGSRIIQTGLAAKENFYQIKKINSTLPEVLYNYAIYLICILQDNFTAQKLLEESKKLEQQKQCQPEAQQQEQIEAFEKQSIALVIVSASEEELGKITRINLLFTQLSGYFKQQIVGRKLQKLMPEIYTNYHYQYMQKWSKQNKQKSKYLEEQHQSFLKQKSGFLLPIKYKIIYNPFEQIFMSHFSIQNNFRNYAYIITDANGIIKQISASVHSYFEIKKQDIQSQILNIDDYIQNALVNQQYFTQKGKYIQYHLNEEKRKYNVIAKQINSNEKQNNESEESFQQENMIKYKNVTIGYEFKLQRIQIKSFLSNKNQMKNSMVDSNAAYSIPQVSSQVLKLYDAPINQEFERYITNEKSNIEFINYGLKIKTLRLTNNQLHMIYMEDQEQNFSGDFEQSEDEQGKVRFDDQRYAQVIKKAINTDFQHIQILTFKWISLFSLIIIIVIMFVQMWLSSSGYETIKFYVQNNYYRAQESVFLNDMISTTLEDQSSINHTFFINQINNNINNFTSSALVNCLLQGDTIVHKNIGDILILIQGRLREFYANGSSAQSIQISYINYLENIYPFLYNYTDSFQNSLIFIIPVCFSLGIFISFFIVSVWIIVKLKIQKKRFDILIWFLDIPIPYVSYLNNKCDKYLKSFVNMKQKNIKEAEDIQQNHFQSYVEKKQQGQQQLQQQQKTRKNLISRHKKKTFISKFDKTYIKYFLLMVYFAIFPIFDYIMTNYNISTINFLKPQFEDSIRQVYRIGVYQIVNKLIMNNYTFQIKNQSLKYLSTNIQNQFLNQINKNSLKTFNLNINTFSNQNILNQYSQVYFQSICSNLSDEICPQLLQGSVDHGIISVDKYIYSNQNINFSDLYQSNLNYIEPTLLNLLLTQVNFMQNLISNSEYITSISYYIYAIITILLFLTFWLLYLRELNLQLNQTIQMLNMIPLKVLPNSNKQTKRFIRWIITESNKLQHRQQ